MTDTTPRTGAPLLAAAQAQKHVTHNEALYQFDAFLCAQFQSRALAAPPSSLADGETWLVAAFASGDWAGHDGAIAYRADGGWRFYAPFAGMVATVADESALIIYAGGAWVDYASVLALQNVPLIGVNTTADATNKLAAKSAAVLFDNVGNGVQAKLNKHAATDTASILYQTNYSGRAELGLTGDDDFHVKVSPDGASWHESITIDSATGRVGVNNPSPSYTLDIAGGIGASNSLGTLASGTNTGNSFSAAGAANVSGDGQIIGTAYSATVTGANNSGYNIGLRLNGNVSGTAGTAANMRACYGNVAVSGGMALTAGEGFNATPYIQGTANMTNWTAYTAGSPSVTGTGDIVGVITGFNVSNIGRSAASAIFCLAISDQTPPASGNAIGIRSALTAASNKYNIYIDGSAQNYMAGALGIGTSAPSCKLDVVDDHIRVRTSKTPSSAAASGDAGDIAWDSSYVYVCVAANTWKRAALSAW